MSVERPAPRRYGELKPQTEKPVPNFLVMTVARGEDAPQIDPIVDMLSRDFNIPAHIIGNEADIENHIATALATREPVIIASSVGGWLARSLRTGGPNILYTHSQSEERKRKAEEEKMKRKAGTYRPNENTTHRQTWKKILPGVSGNPMDPGFRDKNGNRVYNFSLRVDGLSEEQIVGLTYVELMRRGFLKRA